MQGRRQTGLATRPHAPLAGVPAPTLLLAGIASLQLGQAFGKSLFPVLAPTGVATLRLTFAALVLGLLHRKPLPREPRIRTLVVGQGVAIAGMNLIYPALERSPVGVAVALQFLGPLCIALLGSRRRVDLLWALLAGAGITLFLDPSGGDSPSTSGVLLALASGAAWALYLLLTRRMGAHTTDGRTLVPAVTIAALLTAPAGAMAAGVALVRPRALLGGLAIALLTAVLPYSIDLVVLRRLPARVVGVLSCFEPLLGGLAAAVVLREMLTPVQWLAVGSVVGACVGTIVTRQPAAGGVTARRGTRAEAAGD